MNISDVTPRTTLAVFNTSSFLFRRDSSWRCCSCCCCCCVLELESFLDDHASLRCSTGPLGCHQKGPSAVVPLVFVVVDVARLVKKNKGEEGDAKYVPKVNALQVGGAREGGSGLGVEGNKDEECGQAHGASLVEVI
ncbi:hypothetical protein Pcinc_023288 [Petrolisthes cinctipes]|uniref:Uncharacterized protein n=1 Tax=Petrolisthes cinctipes TaxID=88211 RepID=A0AAE1FDA2_PETCI|nr:hypothetical protein Pcinc_023288 [Petrolisthes cinctipes]